jgi:hypothetical protein
MEVGSTTQITANAGTLSDSRKFGYAVVCEALTFRKGTSGDENVRNVVPFIYEERITLSVERPSAVLKVTGLTTAQNSQWHKAFRLFTSARCTRPPNQPT